MQSFIDHPSQGDTTRLAADQLAVLRSVLISRLDAEKIRLNRNEELFRSLSLDSTVDGIERSAARRAASEAFASIQRTNRALDAITDGTYGLCLTCGRSIPFERLEAVPDTSTCVACPRD